MNSATTAAKVGEIIALAQERITGIGAQQYAKEQTQLFERLPLEALVEYQLEEVLDQINYAAFLYIRLSLLQRALQGYTDLIVLQRTDAEQLVATACNPHTTDELDAALQPIHDALKQAH